MRPAAAPSTVTGIVAFLPAATRLSRPVAALKRAVETGSLAGPDPVGFFEENVQLAAIRVEAAAT